MNLKTITLLGGFALFTMSCGASKTYDILPKSNTTTTGTVSFTETNGEVTLKIKAKNLTPGIHAVHLHEKADCSSADGESAGGHWNPSKMNHGRWGGEHFHMGDIGNLTADDKGNAELTFKTDQWCLDCVDESKNILGKGMIIHAAADDFQTQPTGNAGGRVGCVEIK